MSKRAFTLVELLIVITIIGVLVVALLPRLTSGREKARDAARLTHIQQLSTSLEFIVDDFLSGQYPYQEDDVDYGVMCLGREDIQNFIGNYLSTVPVEVVEGNRWAGSRCTGDERRVPSENLGGERGEITMVATPTQGYDFLPTLNGYIIIAKLENERATGEFIYNEAELLSLYNDNGGRIDSFPTQSVLAALVPCEAPGDCTVPLAVAAR